MRPITWGPPSGTEKTGNITFPQTTYAGGIYIGSNCKRVRLQQIPFSSQNKNSSSQILRLVLEKFGYNDYKKNV